MVALVVCGCGGGNGRGNGMQNDGGNFGDGFPNGQGCSMVEFTNCYTVYAHSDTILYKIDLKNKALITLGPFNAPNVGTRPDTMTDLAVAPDNTIYTISKTNLYTADPNDGHVTLIGPVTACGTYAVALTFGPDGNLYAGDYMGAFCRLDPHSGAVLQQGNIGGGMALAGDVVAVGDGTFYGTAYNLADGTSSGSSLNNLLIKIDPQTGSAISTVGATGFPKMFGVAYELGQVFGFTHDGSGDVVIINPSTGAGTLYGTFMDPMTGKGISFAGAGVNSMVSPTIM